MSWIYSLLETDLIPTGVIRYGIQSMLKQKISENTFATVEKQQDVLMNFIEELKQSPIAIAVNAANEQHYEVPSAFYDYALGPRKKYSGCYWHNPKTNAPATSLTEAEEIMLALCCERADIKDGQHILDLGCGWGSMSLWLAEKYPNAKITGFSNSRTQKTYIDAQCQKKQLGNLEIVTGNIAEYPNFPDNRKFDRIISIEMFEHMKNYELLLEKLNGWMQPEAKLFVHIFTHRLFAYHFENKDGNDWLTEYFFTGGTMPSDDLLLYFQKDLRLKKHWQVDGTHYEKTANAWFENMQGHKAEILPILATTYGEKNVKRWWVYWKVFFLACAELWGYQKGRQWLVSHYLFEKPSYAL